MKQHPIFRKDKKRISRVLFISLAVFMAVVVGLSSCIQNEKQQTVVKGPHLEKRGDVTQLIVKGKPWLVLGCELGNSTSSSRSYLAPYWQQLKESGVNTVLAVVSTRCWPSFRGNRQSPKRDVSTSPSSITCSRMPVRMA